MRGKLIELEKEKKILPGKDKRETLAFIPLMPLVGANHCQHILHTSKIIFHCYCTDDSINRFAVCYMINPSLNCNKVFEEQVEKFLSVSFHSRTMETIRYFLMKNNTFVMSLIMIYENNG